MANEKGKAGRPHRIGIEQGLLTAQRMASRQRVAPTSTSQMRTGTAYDSYAAIVG